MTRSWLVLVALAGHAVPVHAEPATTRDQSGPSNADLLFEQGRVLAKAARFAEACARFADSDAIQRTFGTAVNLGDCAKRDGDALRAWQLYEDAVRRAERDGAMELANFARERARSVESGLCAVLVTFEDPAMAVAVTVGGRDVPPAAEIRELVAPGDVDVVAENRTWRAVRRVRCSAAGQRVAVVFPAERVEIAAPAQPSPAAQADAGPGMTAEANVGIAAGDMIRAGWQTYVAVDTMIGLRVTSRVELGGRLTGLIGASGVRAMLRSPDRVVSGGPVVGGFAGPAIRVIPVRQLALGAGAGVGALLASPTGRAYAPALALGASYAFSATWQVSLEGIGMKHPEHLGAAVIALLGARWN